MSRDDPTYKTPESEVELEATIESFSAEKAREKQRRIAAEASARKWKSRQRSTEQKLGYEEVSDGGRDERN